MRIARVGLLAVAMLLVLAPGASAHTENSEGFSRLTMGPAGDVGYVLRVDYFELGRVVDLGVQPGVSDATAAAALHRRTGLVSEYLADRVRLWIDDSRCDARLVGSGVERIVDRLHARLKLTFACPGSAEGEYRIRYSVFFEDNDAAHRNIASYRLGAATGEFIFTAGNRELVAGRSSLVGTARRFVPLGVEHILGGLDHLLFLVALIVAVRSLHEIALTASAFTLGHSATLGLTALGWLQVPSRVVEPLIALSIAYVAAHTLVGAEHRRWWRLPVVATFGLLHGMGFAGALRLTGDVDATLLGALFSFNLGVEIGQALVIVAVVPIVAIARRFRWSELGYRAASAGLAAIGAVWFVECLALR